MPPPPKFYYCECTFRAYDYSAKFVVVDFQVLFVNFSGEIMITSEACRVWEVLCVIVLQNDILRLSNSSE